MGTLTFAEVGDVKGFQELLLRRLGNRVDAAVETAELSYWINQAYAHLTYPSVHQFEQLQTTFDITLASGVGDLVGDIDLDTVAGYRVLAIRSIHFLNSTVAIPDHTVRRHRLTPKAIQWYDERIHATSEPRRYTSEAGSLLLDPVPGSNEVGKKLRVRCWRERVPLATAANTTVLPDYWDMVLLKGAQALAEIDLGQRDIGMESLQFYTDLVNELKPQTELEGDDWGFEVEVANRPLMRAS